MITLSKGGNYITDITTGKLKLKHTLHIKNVMSKYSKEITDKLQEVINTGTRSGRVYIIKGVRHQASAEGEPPITLSGRLSSNFGSTVNDKETHIFNSAESDNGQPYPLFLEEGTSKMGKRPYFVNTIESFNSKIHTELGDCK